MTQSDERQTIWLTQEAFDKKTAELEELRGPVRADIVSRISAARDEGDLKENGGYHAAREELGKLEGRVAQLEQMLEKAEVGQAADDGTISPGFKVSLPLRGRRRRRDVPARRPRDGRRRHPGLQPAVPPRLRADRRPRRRDRELPGPQRQAPQGRSSSRPAPTPPDASPAREVIWLLSDAEASYE